MKKIAASLFAACFLPLATQAAAYKIDKPGDTFFGASLLYGLVADDDLNQLTWTQRDDNNNTESLVTAPNSSPGFRITLGKYTNVAENNFLTAEYTYLSNSASDSASGTLFDLVGVLPSTEFPPADNRRLTGANASMNEKFTIHELNLLSHNTFYTSSNNRISAASAVGVSAVQFKRRLNAEYAGTTPGVTLGDISDQTDFKHTLSAIAPKVMVEGRWHVANNISLGGFFGLGVAIGQLDSKFDETLVSDLAGTFTFSEHKNKVAWLTPLFEVGLGVKSTFDLKNDRHLDVDFNLEGKRYLLDGSIDTIFNRNNIAGGIASPNAFIVKNSLLYETAALSVTYRAI